jgi:hypothetical protein
MQTAWMFGGTVLMAEIVLVVFVVLASRAPLRAIGRLFAGKPKLAEKSIVEAELEPAFNAAPDFRIRFGASAFAAISRVFRPESAIEHALSEVDDGFERGDGKSDGPYDYKHNEEQKLSRSGLLFKWIGVKPAYMPDTAQMSDEIADIYNKVAGRFFSGQVNISADIASLYEDVEGAVIIYKFRVRDRRCYYLLNEMRRVIDDNVRKLAFFYSGIVWAVLVTELFFIDAIQSKLAGSVQNQGIADFLAGDFNRSLAGLVLCGIGIFLMWLSYYMEYVPNQRNNGREMRSFLSRYLSRLSDRYRDALANARAVTVGDETDGAVLSAKAQKWHKIMLWLSFRVFFIESFVRNVLFQIGRNCGYYIVLCPLYFFLGLAVTLLVLAMALPLSLGALFAAPGIAFYAGFAVLLGLAVFFLNRAMRPFDEMNQTDWLGFDNLNVDKGMDQVVGKYAEDVGYWKGRLDR